MRRIDQIVMGAAPGDAITSMAVRLREACRYFGPSDIYALHIAPEAGRGTDIDAHQVLDIGSYSADDVVIYHSSMGDPRVTQILENCRARLIVHFHNITPHSYFVGVNESLAMSSLWGREELSRLLDRCVAASADSEFNAAELGALGYRDVHVSPVGVVPDRLAGLASSSVMDEIAERFPDGFVVSVSQQLPHKRTELAIASVHLLQTVWEREVGLVVIGGSPAPSYVERLHRFSSRLGVERCEFWGRVNNETLAAAIGAASVLAVTSDHEGLAIPPLEAMSVGTPVVARGCGAVPDTLGAGAIVGPDSSGPTWLAAAIHTVTTDSCVRNDLVAAGMTQVQELVDRGDVWSYLEWLQEHV